MPAAKLCSERNGALFRMVSVSLLASASATPAVVVAQTEPAISQAVVQPLPPREISDLNSALRRLARNSRDVGALIDAGNASLAVDDIEAAIGFFGRADELSPNNPRVKVGLAGAFVRRERPIEALRLFAEAERAGASTDQLAADRALAYDLVGDNAAAQRLYQRALAKDNDPEIRRRFALSHAIAGNREAFEKILYPLLEKRDFAAYRTRAFAMAIMGDDAEAVAIAEAVMPRDMSARIAPYLRYMPRLTKAQQAAAANLGIFPRAAQIGRDSAQIAAYTSGSEAVSKADERLAPQGEPLGTRVAVVDASSPRRRPDRARSEVAGVASAELDGKGRDAAQPQSQQPVSDPMFRASQSVAAKNKVAENTSEKGRTDVESAGASTAVGVAGVTVPVVQGTSIAGGSGTVVEPGFDLGTVQKSDPTVRQDNRVVVSTLPKRTEQPAEDPTSVAEAFANLSLRPAPSYAAPSGAVDMSKLKPPIEPAKQAVPEPPKHPRRFWVQVATGKDRSALKFDWRRISRKSGDVLKGQSPWVTPWGQSNRLLSGPYESLQEARKVMNLLKKSEVDSFTYTSPEGQQIESLR